MGANSTDWRGFLLLLDRGEQIPAYGVRELIRLKRLSNLAHFPHRWGHLDKIQEDLEEADSRDGFQGRLFHRYFRDA